MTIFGLASSRTIGSLPQPPRPAPREDIGARSVAALLLAADCAAWAVALTTLAGLWAA